MKSVGIIGGLGPETSAEFYLEVVFGCQKVNSSQRPLIVMSSVPLLVEIENDLIESNKGKERYIPYLVKEAKRLEAAGVDFLVMPCNSLHVFIEDIRSVVKIPVLSIVEETANHIRDKGYGTIGLISTSATIANQVYENVFQENNIGFISPNGLQKAEMDKIIQRLINGQHLNNDRENIIQVAKDLAESGASAIALACTDLQLLLPQVEEVPVFDTMKVLAHSTVREIMS